MNHKSEVADVYKIEGIMFRVILPLAAGLISGLVLTAPAKALEVYFFKGAGDFSFINENMHFSRGLNQMADALNKEGIRAEVRRFGAVAEALRVVRKRKPKTIAIIGHSMGALASMSMARQLKGEGIRIAYMGLIDIPGPVGVAGDNVEWVENYYSVTPVYGLLTNASSHRNAKNIHVFGYIHNRMDDSPKVKNGMLSAVRKVYAEGQEEFDPVPEVETRMAGLNARPDALRSATPAVPAEPSVAALPQPITVSATAGGSLVGWSAAERAFNSAPAGLVPAIEGYQAYEDIARRNPPAPQVVDLAPRAYGANRAYVPPAPVDGQTTASVLPGEGNESGITDRIRSFVSSGSVIRGARATDRMADR